ncbi:MAG: DedA family protein [Bacteroidaceae bacterium]|nr:DedA family protein [Bacteroidaceae bacterium]MDY6250602.1 YqaA family protein [Bacteroidaceae bacterium]
MDALSHFLLDYGLWGMFVSALLAGSVLPFSSEVVIVGLAAAGVSSPTLLITATAGNVLGGAINYAIGSLGKEEWIYKCLRMDRQKLEQGLRYAHRYGAWGGLLAWVPVIGSVVTVALGYLRTNFLICLITMAIGKWFRYAVLLYGYNLIST